MRILFYFKVSKRKCSKALLFVQELVNYEVMAKKEWWQKIFSDEEMGRLMFRWPEKKTVQEVASVIRKSGLKKGARILDLGCGKGRHSIELARRGYKVTGIDQSTLYLKEARGMTKKMKNAPEFIRGDIRDLSSHFESETFDGVINLWNSFGYFATHREDQRVLKQVSRVLKPGGKFVLNALSVGGVEEEFGLYVREKWSENRPGNFFLERGRWNLSKQRLVSEWLLLDLSKRKVKRFEVKQNIYSPEDFRDMLKRVDLTMENLWGPLSGGPYTFKSWQQSWVAAKRVD